MRTRTSLALAVSLTASGALSALSAHAQLAIGAGTLMSITDSVVYVTGPVQSAGELRTTAGRLFIQDGDFLSTGDSRPGTGRVRLESSSARVVTLSDDTLHRLQLNVPAGTTLGSSAVIKSALDLLGGHLNTTSGFQLRLTPSAVVNGETAARYVRGSLVQQRALSGSAPVSFGGMGVAVNPAGQNLTLQVDRRAGLSQLNYSFGQGPVAGIGTGIDRIWRLSTPGAVNPAAPVAITLAWVSADDHGLSTALLVRSKVWRSNDNGTTWVAASPEQDASTSRSVTLSATDLNAWYTVSASNAPLPVELTRFDAKPRGKDALLTWATASEKNAAWFVVERAVDATKWTAAGRVAAAGTSAVAHEYKLTDAGIGARGTAFYYRLRQIDADGKETLPAAIKLVEFSAPQLALDAYPVPLGEFLTLDLTAPTAGPLTVDLVDATGRRVRQETYTAQAGLNTWRLDTKSLAKGTYVLRATIGGQTLTRRLVTSQ